MPLNHCAVCQKELISLELKTIANQSVCCLSCVGLLPSIAEDACDFCFRPVWKDNYFTLNSKYYCSENCKENKKKQMLSEKLITDTIGIKEQHHQDDKIYISSPEIDSKKLREEALEIFNELDENIIPRKNKSLNKNNLDALSQRDLRCDKFYIGEDIYNNLNTQIQKIKVSQCGKKKIINHVIPNNMNSQININGNIFKKIHSDSVSYKNNVNKLNENSNIASKSNSKSKIKLRSKNSRVCLIPNKTNNNTSTILNNNNRQILKKIQKYGTLDEYNDININNIHNKSEIYFKTQGQQNKKMNYTINYDTEENICPNMRIIPGSLCFNTSSRKLSKAKNCKNSSRVKENMSKDFGPISKVITQNVNYCNNCNRVITESDVFYLGKNKYIFCSYNCRKNYQVNKYDTNKSKENSKKLMID